MGLALAKKAAELVTENTQLYAKRLDGEVIAELRDKNQVIDPSTWHHLYQGCLSKRFKSVDDGREKCAVSIKSASHFYRVARFGITKNF